MPPVSEPQRRYIYARAAAGEAWAIKFLKDSGLPLPKLRDHVHAHMHKHRK